MTSAGRSPSNALLRTLAALRPGTRVLDVACGHGHHTVALAALGFDVWACDADADAVATTRGLVDAALGEGEGTRRVLRALPASLGYPDGFAAWVAISNLDGADAEIVEVLREARRVLAPGGWLWTELEDRAPDDLLRLAEAADLAVAEAPRADVDRGTSFATFRRVGPGVVA